MGFLVFSNYQSIKLFFGVEKGGNNGWGSNLMVIGIDINLILHPFITPAILVSVLTGGGLRNGWLLGLWKQYTPASEAIHEP